MMRINIYGMIICKHYKNLVSIPLLNIRINCNVFDHVENNTHAQKRSDLMNRIDKKHYNELCEFTFAFR